jgi:hypothetical protein
LVDWCPLGCMATRDKSPEQRKYIVSARRNCTQHALARTVFGFGGVAWSALLRVLVLPSWPCHKKHTWMLGLAWQIPNCAGRNPSMEPATIARHGQSSVVPCFVDGLAEQQMDPSFCHAPRSDHSQAWHVVCPVAPRSSRCFPKHCFLVKAFGQSVVGRPSEMMAAMRDNHPLCWLC